VVKPRKPQRESVTIACVLSSDAVETTATESVTYPQESKRTASIGATGKVID